MSFEDKLSCWTRADIEEKSVSKYTRPRIKSSFEKALALYCLGISALIYHHSRLTSNHIHMKEKQSFLELDCGLNFVMVTQISSEPVNLKQNKH